MQKHADRIDKRPPIGPGANMELGLPTGDPYWPKMDPMAMYGYQQPAIMDHIRLNDREFDSRDVLGPAVPSTTPWTDTRTTSSAFSPLQANTANAGNRANSFYDTLPFSRASSQVRCLTITTLFRPLYAS